MGLGLAAFATLSLVVLRANLGPPTASDQPPIRTGSAAPDIVGTTLTGATFRLADLRGTPVIVNFWGPSCVPCRDEFPLFKSKLAELGDDLAIVGILMHDPPAPALDFITEFQATWPTVDDPSAAIRNAYRVAARPQSYFIDRDGILRSIQVGELTEGEFQRQYARISGPPASGDPEVSIGITPPP